MAIVYDQQNSTPSSHISYDDQGSSDFGNAIKGALRTLLVKNPAAIKDLLTNPETMANAMPSVAGATGAMMPVPGGATMGTAAGQGVRDLALKALGKPIPSGWRHAGELGGAALGDVIAFPSINRARIGGEIGAVEKAAGVPPVQDIKSLPMPTGAKSTSEFIDDAVNSVSSSGGKGTPTYWKQIKDQVDRLYNLGKDTPLSNLDKGKLQWLNGQVQKGLNASVPGRAPLAADLARSQIIPNAIGKVARSIPWWGKATAGAVGGDALVRAIANVAGHK